MIHTHAQKRPYFDLDGYMIRKWIFGDGSPERNLSRPDWAPAWHGRQSFAPARLLAQLVAVRAHTILRSDEGRDLHDHPFASLSVILDDGYWEVERPRFPLGEVDHEERELVIDMISASSSTSPPLNLRRRASAVFIHWRPAGVVVWREASHYHRLIVPRGRSVRTIFCMGPRVQDWGFLTPAGKVLASQYQHASAWSAPSSSQPQSPPPSPHGVAGTSPVSHAAPEARA